MREMRTHIVLETLTVEFSGRRKRRRDRRKNSSKRECHCWMKSRPPPASAGVPCGGDGGDPVPASSGTSAICTDDDIRLNIRSLSSKAAGANAAAPPDANDTGIDGTRAAGA